MIGCAPDACLSFACYGVSITIGASDVALLGAIESCFPFGARPTEVAAPDRTYAVVASGHDDPATTYALYVDGALERAADRLERLLGMLRRDLELNVARLSPDYVFVHAGAVVWRDRAVLFPGRSFAGKSTLVAELVEAGAGYLSDEFALIDDEGRVHPYPRPLSLRPSSPRSGMPATAIGGGPADVPRAGLPVGGVVITRFRPGGQWQPRAVDTGEGILGLLAHTVPARERPVAAFRALKQAVIGATVLVGDRGEAADTAQQLLARFSEAR
jgi:hypothetical protein